MHGHLVAVKVGIEGGADQGMQADGLALNQNRVKRLDAEAMQGRGAVKENGVALDDLVENVPDFLPALFNPLLGIANRMDMAAGLQEPHNKGLEQG